MNKGYWSIKEIIDELLKIQDVAEILKVSEGTIRRMLDCGELKGIRVGDYGAYLKLKWIGCLK